MRKPRTKTSPAHAAASAEAPAAPGEAPKRPARSQTTPRPRSDRAVRSAPAAGAAPLRLMVTRTVFVEAGGALGVAVGVPKRGLTALEEAGLICHEGGVFDVHVTIVQRGAAADSPTGLH